MLHINYLSQKQNIRMLLSIIISLALLSACQSASRYSTVNTDVLDDIQRAIEESRSSQGAGAVSLEQPPVEVLEALVPGLTLNGEILQPVPDRFDLVVQQAMDVRDFFSLLTQGTDYSIVVHPGVGGSISALDLKNVTIEEVLEQVSTLYGFVVNRTGDIFQVLPGGLQTRIFKVDYLNVTRNGTSNMQIVASGITQSNQSGFGNNNFGGGAFGGVGGLGNQGIGGIGGFGNQGFGNGQFGGQNSGGASINTISESDWWEGLEDILLSIINSGQTPGNGGGLAGSSNAVSNDRSVVVSPHTGIIVVRAYPDELTLVAEFLERSQTILERQVVLEAKILEVELKEGFQAGIDLSILGKVNTDNEFLAEFSFIGEQLNGIGTPLTLSLKSTDFAGVIRLLETQGNVQVISSPRISTLNNQKAVFKVGDERYFLTSTNTTSFGAGDTATTNQNTNLQPFFSGIALDVTPQISDEGDIILHIHPIISQVQEEIKLIRGEEFSLAKSITRESDSIARVRNGEVIIISGLMQTRARGMEAGVPGVRNVPVIGNAFAQRQQEMVKTELVILLRAFVDEDDIMQTLIDEHAEGFENIRRQMDPYFR